MLNTEYYESFPHPVRVTEHVWIPLSDSCRLSAKLWLPEGSDEQPVPAILEYIPYRKGDATAPRDQMNHSYFAGHGLCKCPGGHARDGKLRWIADGRVPGFGARKTVRR